MISAVIGRWHSWAQEEGKVDQEKRQHGMEFTMIYMAAGGGGSVDQGAGETHYLELAEQTPSQRKFQ
jgi:hypothetical protein